MGNTIIKVGSEVVISSFQFNISFMVCQKKKDAL